MYRSGDTSPTRAGRRRKPVICFAVLAIAAAAVSACASSASSQGGSGGGASAADYRVGIITDLTGSFAAERSQDVEVAQATVDQINASGGINGHKVSLSVADEGSSPSGAVTAARQLVQNDHVLGIVSNTIFIDDAAPYLHQQNVPIIGLPIGNTWGAQPYTNQFGAPWIQNPDPNKDVEGVEVEFLKSHGATNFAVLGLAAFPQSLQTQIANTAKIGEELGMHAGLVEEGLPAVPNFTNLALSLKNAHINGIVSFLEAPQNVSLMEAMNQAGLNVKVTVLEAGYAPGFINTSDEQALQGVYIAYPLTPMLVQTPGTEQMKAAFEKYAPGADDTENNAIMYSGLQTLFLGIKAAGSNPTSSSIIEAVDKLSNYNANGLWANRVPNYETSFGQGNRNCEYMLQVSGSKYVAVSQQPVCGKLYNF